MNNQNDDSSNLYSEEMLTRYRRGDLSAADQHALEKAALDDPLLADAVDGLETMPEEDYGATMLSLQDRLGQRTQQEEKKVTVINWRYMGVAATLLLLLTAGWWSLSLFDQAAGEDASYKMESPAADPASVEGDPNATAASGAGEPDYSTEIAEEPLGTRGQATATAPGAGSGMGAAGGTDMRSGALAATEPEAEVSEPASTAAIPAKGQLAMVEEAEDEESFFEEESELLIAAREHAEAADEVPVIATEVATTQSGTATTAGIDVELDGTTIEVMDEEAAFAGEFGDAIAEDYDADLAEEIAVVSSTAPAPSAAAEPASRDLSMFIPEDGLMADTINIVAFSDEELAQEAGEDRGQTTGNTGPGSMAKRKASRASGGSQPLDVSTRPEPAFGRKAFERYLESAVKDMLKKHPVKRADRQNVLVRFTVTTDSQVVDFEIPDSVKEPWASEIKRIIKEGPPWVPALDRGVQRSAPVELVIELK